MNKLIFKIFWFCVVATCLCGCLKNDLPYPRITQNITSLVAVGESQKASLDTVKLKATVYLEETTDIQNVQFTKFAVSPGGEPDLDLLDGTWDLENPLYLSITRFQTYIWEIEAEQDIPRYFKIKDQVGNSLIDVAAHRVIVYLDKNADLSDLKIEDMKLGPAGITTYSPNLSAGSSIDLSKTPFLIEVTYHNRTDYWNILVDLVEQTVATNEIAAGGEVLWVSGTCQDNVKGGIQYRKSTETAWTDLEDKYITQTGGTFTGYIPHLVPDTEYVVRTVAGGEYGKEVSVKTTATEDLEDGSFEEWSKDGKEDCPWAEGQKPYWGTGNPASAALLGLNCTTPTDHVVPGISSQKAAMLSSKWVLVKLAAGSIFTGKFKERDGMDGVLEFGREFTLRPTKLCGYFQYQGKDIDKATSEYKHLIGQPDSCHIYIALTDWTAPYVIRTKATDRQLFDKNADYVIAYGEKIYAGNMEEYEYFEIPIVYRDPFTTPSYIQITCSSSKYGDFYTGGNGSVLYVDEFSLHYDY